jgi:hypothetical protein
MSEDEADGLAVPAFDATAALQRLQRELRAAGLAERGGQFERRGSAIAQLRLDGAVVQAAVVKRPSRSSPEWQRKTLHHAGDVRDFLADLKKRLALWSDRDD